MPSQILTSDLTTFSDDSSTGSLTWGSPSNAQTSDDSYAFLATVPILGTGPFTTHYLKATGLGSALPVWASVLISITVLIERHAQSTPIIDASVRLVKAGSVLAAVDKSGGVGWPLSDGIASYVFSQSDLATLGISLSDINNASFGCAMACTWDDRVSMTDGTALVDHIYLQIAFSSGGAAASGLLIVPALSVSC